MTYPRACADVPGDSHRGRAASGSRLSGGARPPPPCAHSGNRIYNIKDGLPKYKETPIEHGGTGEMLPEG